MSTTSLLPDVGVEVREGYAEVGDVNLHYVEAGDGPLIVLLHGFPEFWFGWRLQIAPLVAAGFRVVAPDTRGYNLSSKPEPPRGRRSTRHPQRGPSAAACGGTAQSEPAPEVLVLLLLCNTGNPRGRCARQRLALLPTLPP